MDHTPPELPRTFSQVMEQIHQATTPGGETPPQPSPTPPKEEKTPDDGAINIRVVGQDGSEVFFRIKTNTPLSKLMDAYCDRQSINRQQVRFMFDGERLPEGASAKSLDMEDNDVIDAMLQQVGG